MFIYLFRQTKGIDSVPHQLFLTKLCTPGFDSNDLKSRVVYKLSCSGCTSTYVEQIVQHLTARIEEHKKADSLVGLHLQQCQLEGNRAILVGKLQIGQTIEQNC